LDSFLFVTFDLLFWFFIYPPKKFKKVKNNLELTFFRYFQNGFNPDFVKNSLQNAKNEVKNKVKMLFLTS